MRAKCKQNDLRIYPCSMHHIVSYIHLFRDVQTQNMNTGYFKVIVAGITEYLKYIRRL